MVLLRPVPTNLLDAGTSGGVGDEVVLEQIEGVVVQDVPIFEITE